MTTEERVKALHDAGCNCCQSLLMACGESAGLSQDQAYRLGTFFGGGMRRGEVCGAIAGSLMLIGLKEGTPDNQRNPKAAMLMKAFKDRYGSIRCRELLDEDGKKNKALCEEFISFCIDYLEGAENP